MSMYHTSFDVYTVNAVTIFFVDAGHPRVPRKERHEKIALPSLYLSEQLSARSVSQLAQLMACCPGNIAYANLPLALSFGVCDFVEAKNWIIAILMQVPFILLTCRPIGNGQMLLCID